MKNVSSIFPYFLDLSLIKIIERFFSFSLAIPLRVGYIYTMKANGTA